MLDEVIINRTEPCGTRHCTNTELEDAALSQSTCVAPGQMAHPLG